MVGPTDVVSSDGVDDFTGKDAKDLWLERCCQSCRKCRVRGLGDAAGEAAGGSLGLFECRPCLVSGCFGCARIVDAEDHAGLDAEVRGHRMCGLFG